MRAAEVISEPSIVAARLPVVDLLGAKFQHVLVNSSQDDLGFRNQRPLRMTETNVTCAHTAIITMNVYIYIHTRIYESSCKFVSNNYHH